MIVLGNDWQMRAQETEVLFLELLTLSEKERTFVRNSQWEVKDMEELNGWITQRQEIMNRIDEIRLGDQDHLMNQAATIEDSSDTKKALEVISQHRENCRKIILQIEENDRVSRTGMEQASQKTGARIASTRNTKKASMAYKPFNSTNEAWFFDKKK